MQNQEKTKEGKAGKENKKKTTKAQFTFSNSRYSR